MESTNYGNYIGRAGHVIADLTLTLTLVLENYGHVLDNLYLEKSQF